MTKTRFTSPRYGESERRMAEALADLEARALDPAPRSDGAKEDDCECKEGMFPAVSRRSLLAGGTTLGLGVNLDPIPDDPTRVQGRPVLSENGYGSRSQFESEVRWRYTTPTAQSSWSMTPLASGHGIVTPSGLHFERHHAGIPTIDSREHTLILHGMVNQPMRFTMNDLMRLPSVSRMHFIECSGNTLTEWEEPTLRTVQGTHGLTSTSEWTGVKLSTVLEMAGPQDSGTWILADGADAAVMTRSVPVEKAMDDAILAYAQNGEALRPEQGYPLRLLLPGFEGNMQIKWLRRLEVSDMPFMTREETSKYTDLMPDGEARQFTFEMDAKSSSPSRREPCACPAPAITKSPASPGRDGAR